MKWVILLLPCHQPHHKPHHFSHRCMGWLPRELSPASAADEMGDSSSPSSSASSPLSSFNVLIKHHVILIFFLIDVDKHFTNCKWNKKNYWMCVSTKSRFLKLPLNIKDKNRSNCLFIWHVATIVAYFHCLY